MTESTKWNWENENYEKNHKSKERGGMAQLGRNYWYFDRGYQVVFIFLRMTLKVMLSLHVKTRIFRILW